MFSPDLFKIIAAEIACRKIENASEQAVFRTAIGRLYYYIFLELRDHFVAKSNVFKELLDPDLNTHSIIRKTILGLKDLRDEGQALNELRQARNECDYIPVAIVNEKIYEAMKRKCSLIENSIEKIICHPDLEKSYHRALSSSRRR